LFRKDFLILADETRIQVGDHVEWNSEAGYVRGRTTKKVTSAMKFKTYTVRASKEEPQYLIKSDKTDPMAMHTGAALKKLGKHRRSSKKRLVHSRRHNSEEMSLRRKRLLSKEE